MKTFAIIDNGSVVNTVVADDGYSLGIDITDISPMPSIGWSYDGSVFHPPIVPALVVTKEMAIAAGYVYLDSLGWNQAQRDALQTMAAFQMLTTQQLQMAQANGTVVLQMLAAASNTSTTFNTLNYTIPYKPSDFGLS